MVDGAEQQYSHLDFGVSVCVQKISGFGMLNNGKVENKLACAQQKC